MKLHRDLREFIELLKSHESRRERLAFNLNGFPGDDADNY
jgi:hypothetical protein